MDPFSGIGAAAVGGLSSIVGAIMQNRAARRESRRQMAFQEQMAGTAYQRSMADMERAGLNPLLAASQGGAHSPAGSAAQVENVMSKGVSSALEARRLVAEMRNMSLQNRLLGAQARQEEVAADIAESNKDFQMWKGRFRNTGVGKAMDVVGENAGSALNAALWLKMLRPFRWSQKEGFKEYWKTPSGTKVLKRKK